MSHATPSARAGTELEKALRFWIRMIDFYHLPTQNPVAGFRDYCLVEDEIRCLEIVAREALGMPQRATLSIEPTVPPTGDQSA